ncbi:hypothetical protein CDL15_Pgr009986 [Punica granatum]|uniref:Uncharacterized protein n=1 Tax=Punica granatum TaxID=22663 RepID=A0A218X5C9_PUNGR|nr:hypothetical protein CDL15_Pgr009986 [Punica granatum]
MTVKVRIAILAAFDCFELDDVDALHDGKDAVFLLQVDGDYAYSKGENTRCPSVDLKFQIGESGTYHNLEKKSANMEEEGLTLYNERKKGNDTSAQNNWKGAWWHSSLSVQSGFVEEDGPYASNGQKGAYYFEFSRPLRTMDRLQQDAQFTVGGTAKMSAAFWYPVNGNPWHGSGHFSINCDWVSMDISSGTSLLTKTASSGSLWDAASAFSLLFSVISLCLFVFIDYRNFGPKSAQYKPMQISLGQKTQMADIGKAVFDACSTCWDRTANYRRYIKSLGDNLTTLESKLAELGDVYDDVNRLVSTAEEGDRWIRKHDVAGWLHRVETQREKTEEILVKGKDMMGMTCLYGLCLRNCRSRYKQSKLAEAKGVEIETALVEGRNFKVKEDVAYEPADVKLERSLKALRRQRSELDDMFETVKQRVKLEEGKHLVRTPKVGGWLERVQLLLEEVRGILEQGEQEMEKGFQGVGGVSLSQSQRNSTTYYQLSNRAEEKRATLEEELRKASSFTVFTYKPDDPPMFEIPLEPPVGLDSSFEEEIDLLNLGIPCRGHERKSKIIFTTRKEDVCGQMQAERKKKIVCLPADKALELFREKVGEETWTAHVEIPRLAKSLVKECAYLPLALITVGAAMASRKDPDKWRRAIEYLQNRPSGFARMAERVLSVLEFSYEALPNETQKNCFLYCSIFPEDYVYRMDELIDLWMGEGFLSECDGSHEARNLGIYIIEYLIDVCLLEEVNMSTQGSFKMHDVVRDMALWVVSEHGQKNKIVCQKSQRSVEPKEFMKWTNAERIYLQGVDLKMGDFPVTVTAFSSLSTLIIQRTLRKTFPKGFFSSMPSLRVLDLSSNSDLEDLPDDIGALVNLRYLDLRWTEITKLPVELKTLTKLVFLLLGNKCGVPKGLIPSLPSLRVLRISLSQIDEGEELHVIEELNGMNNQIDDVCLELMVAADVQKLLTDCPHLQRCLRRLDLESCEGLRSLIIPKPSLRRMEHLRFLGIYYCQFEEISVVKGESYGCVGETGRSDGSGSPPPPHTLPSSYYPELTSTSSCLESQNCFRSLKTIFIMNCGRLKEVTAVIYHAPSLTDLSILYCSSMRELISGDVEDSHVDRTLSCLIWLYLRNLPELESICKRALPFPSLKSLVVEHCPKLEKLPLDSNSRGSARQLRRIEGGEKWWDGLRWDDPETKQYFSTKFVGR